MKNHTPGPWRMENQAANGEECIGISRDYSLGGAAICEVHSSRLSDVLRADARLIAAAPELLEACETALKFSNRPRNSIDEIELCEVLRAAISKARGGA